jgi:hypothetical protein
MTKHSVQVTVAPEREWHLRRQAGSGTLIEVDARVARSQHVLAAGGDCGKCDSDRHQETGLGGVERDLRR